MSAELEILLEPSEDLWFAIIGHYEPYAMYFHAYEVCPSIGLRAEEYLLKEDSRWRNVSVADALKGPISPYALLHGYVKWDGCCEVMMGVQDGGAAHFCGLEETRKIGKVFDAVYDLARGIEHWFE